MKKLYFFSACFFCFLVTIYAEGTIDPGCLGKEKAFALLETQENLLSRAKTSFPSCSEAVNPTDETGCDRSLESLAYIELSNKLISDIREIFPNCSKPIEKDDKDNKDKEDKEKDKEVKYKDCAEILRKTGRKKNGVYTIWTEEPYEPAKPLQVFCDMETDTVGWTMIQRRGKYKVQQDFNQDWETYKIGFGKLTEEFWLGLENIRVLCAKGCEIRFDFQAQNRGKAFAHYKNFKLYGEDYQISISGFSGTAGDSLQAHNNNAFSTKDVADGYRNKTPKSGWWHGYNLSAGGYVSNLNGVYSPDQYGYDVVFWYYYQTYYNLRSADMKVKVK